MKVPPKRKGNFQGAVFRFHPLSPLNESPSEKEGKFALNLDAVFKKRTLNESPSEKEGKCGVVKAVFELIGKTLNESPSEKEGKLCMWVWCRCFVPSPSMKVPPKRKGNGNQ